MRLEECFVLENGYAFKSKDFIETGIPVIKIKNVKAGCFVDNNFSYVDERFIDEKPSKVARENDVLITMSGNRHDGNAETWVGKVALFTKEKRYLINQRVGALRLKDGVDIDPIFVAYSLSAWKYQNWFISIANSSGGQANISPNQILSTSILLPPIGEQKAIAHILSTLDDKIELNRQMNETLEAVAQALFKSWFVDFDPVIDNALLAGKAIPEPLKQRAEMRQTQLDSGKANTNSEINDLFPSEFEFTEELGWIPKGWRVRPLPELMDFLEGPGIRNWQYTEEEDGINFINIRCIQSGDINLKTANKITREEAFGKYKHFQLEVDDIIMSASGTLGRYAFVRQEHLPLSLNTSVIRFRPINGVSTLYYIAGYIDTKLQWELETRASGSVQRNFGPMHLKKITMFVPDINVLEEHARLSSEIFNKRRNNLEQIDTLIQLRDTLLPKLMSGELRIADAEKLVENI